MVFHSCLSNSYYSSVDFRRYHQVGILLSQSFPSSLSDAFPLSGRVITTLVSASVTRAAYLHAYSKIVRIQRIIIMRMYMQALYKHDHIDDDMELVFSLTLVLLISWRALFFKKTKIYLSATPDVGKINKLIIAALSSPPRAVPSVPNI